MNSDQLLALMPLIAIAATAVAVMLAIAVQRNFSLASSIAAYGIVIALLALSQSWHETPVQATLLLRIDSYSRFTMTLLLLAGLAVLGFSYDYFKDREGENEELPLLLLFALLGACTLVNSSHFAAFFIALEILSVSLFALVGYSHDRSRPLEAALKYLILSGVSSAFLLMGMALIYAQGGELGFAGIARFIAAQAHGNLMVSSGIVLIVAGLGFKLSLVPFHMWTPDVYEGAPAPVAAFIASVSKGAVFVLLLRYFISAGGYAYAPLLNIFSLVAVLSMLGGNLLALLQTNVKRLLAYSSIAHMGYLLVVFIAAAGLAPALPAESAGVYLLAYFIAILGAFGVVSVLSSAQTEAGDVAFYQGLFWRRPWLAAAFTLMLLSLAGLPLTVGFLGKFYIFIAGVEGQLWGLLAAMIIGSGLGLYYYLRIIVSMTQPLDPNARSGCGARAWISSLALTILCLLLLGCGVYPGWLVAVVYSLSG